MAKATYSNHREQLSASEYPSHRYRTMEAELRDAFSEHIEERTVGFIQFDQVGADELGRLLMKHPMILKPILSCVNVASRAIARDLQMNIDTYKPRLDEHTSAILAGYLKPMLPKELAIPALVELDKNAWIDKEMRRNKGNWEALICETINKNSTVVFKKRKFSFGEQKYELDAGYSESEHSILVGIDIKRIESPRDIHKRSDEIINKATHFKEIYPSGKFFAIIYYPFPSQHNNVLSRLQSANIDGTFFAGETDSSITETVRLLLAKAGYSK